MTVSGENFAPAIIGTYDPWHVYRPKPELNDLYIAPYILWLGYMYRGEVKAGSRLHAQQ